MFVANAKRWIVNVLAAIGAIAIAAGVGAYALKSWSNEEYNGSGGREIISPDGMFKAVLFTTQEGGGLSPYCIESIYIARNKVPPNAKVGFERVYVAGCYSFIDTYTGNQTSAPEIKWLSNTQLQIELSVNQGASGVSELALKCFAANGKIKISYLVNENTG